MRAAILLSLCAGTGCGPDVALLTWAVYSFAVFARQRLGWDGRRAAWLSALGFAIILLNFVPVSYFVTTSHTFD